MDQSLFAKRIRAIRRALGMTQAEFAESVGVTREHVGRWESGKVGTTARRIEIICKKLGITEAQFWNVDYLPKSKTEQATAEVTYVQDEEPFPWPSRVAEVREFPSLGSTALSELAVTAEAGRSKESEHFWIRAETDAMVGSGIARGDKLLIRRQDSVEQGELALVHVSSSGYYVRQVQFEGEFVLLIPANDRYQVLLHPRDEVAMIGRVRRILKQV